MWSLSFECEKRSIFTLTNCEKICPWTHKGREKDFPQKPMTKLFFCVSAPCSRRSTSLFKLQTRVPPRPSAYRKHTLLFPHWVSITSEQTVIRPLMRVLSLTPRPNWISQRPLKKLLAAWQPATFKVWVNMAGVEVFSKFQGDYKSTLGSSNISCTSPVSVVQQNILEGKVLPGVGPIPFLPPLLLSDSSAALS